MPLADLRKTTLRETIQKRDINLLDDYIYKDGIQG